MGQPSYKASSVLVVWSVTGYVPRAQGRLPPLLAPFSSGNQSSRGSLGSSCGQVEEGTPGSRQGHNDAGPSQRPFHPRTKNGCCVEGLFPGPAIKREVEAGIDLPQSRREESGVQLDMSCPHPGGAEKEASRWGKATPRDKPFSHLATWSGSVTLWVGLAVLAERAVLPAWCIGLGPRQVPFPSGAVASQPL